jgi:hypothetical protein
MRGFIQEKSQRGNPTYSLRRAAASFNKAVQATPTNLAVLLLRSWTILWYGYGVPDLIRWALHR